MRRLLLLVLPAVALLAAWSHPAAAHEVRPGYLELREQEAGRFSVFWRVPARGDRRLSLDPVFPANCRRTEEAWASIAAGAYEERFGIACEGGLDGRPISIRGLEAVLTDVIVRVERPDGPSQVARLGPDDPSFEVARSAGLSSVAASYFGLGVEHILFGPDHLLFVLGLVFLCTGTAALVATVTAFTAAHSVTLALAALQWVRVPSPPVEAVIALSIVFVATEILHTRAGRPGLASRSPWLVALAFGLLHGLGFAGALSEIGLPAHAVPAALLFFNVGVEVGQLLFVAAVLLVLRVVDRTAAGPTPGAASAASVAVAYAIGILAVYWLVERTAGFWS